MVPGQVYQVIGGRGGTYLIASSGHKSKLGPKHTILTGEGEPIGLAAGGSEISLDLFPRSSRTASNSAQETDDCAIEETRVSMQRLYNGSSSRNCSGTLHISGHGEEGKRG